MKPFASLLFVFYSNFHYIKYKKNFILYFTFIGLLFRRIYSSFNFFKSDSSKSQVSENVYLDIFLENFEKLFKFKFDNISAIFVEEILIDRILTLFLLCYLLIKLIKLQVHNKFKHYEHYIFDKFSFSILFICNSLERHRT